ncbi:hypothetical protein Hamer_G014179 [Homarus americanus]|uniref:Secreted protein n=1 Tax=Homarus americanus TaxID=6706 RepID=A0A8J5JNH1_HOMAM|nr:hypothetical protein Hamer_G014179 [Homarus americanus]
MAPGWTTAWLALISYAAMTECTPATVSQHLPRPHHPLPCPYRTIPLPTTRYLSTLFFSLILSETKDSWTFIVWKMMYSLDVCHYLALIKE